MYKLETDKKSQMKPHKHVECTGTEKIKSNWTEAV